MPQLFSYLLSCTGRVQGVGFRMHVKRIASDIGLTGFVQNEDDGTVTAFAEGKKEELERLIARIKGLHHAIGPDVKEVKISEQKEIEKRQHKFFFIAD